MEAKLYLEYLGNCHFNVAVQPDSIIQFSEGHVRALASIEENHEQATRVEHTYVTKGIHTYVRISWLLTSAPTCKQLSQGLH